MKNLMKIHHLVHSQKIVFEFFHTDEKFFLHVIMFIRKWHSTMIVREWFMERKRRADFIFIKFSISIHHFHQVLDALDQRIVFGFFHTDGKFFLRVIKFIQKWHSTMIVDIIESDVMIEIENLMKIKLAKHASQSSDSRYFYAYTWNIEYWWLDEIYMHENILLLKFQANKWWFWEVDDDVNDKTADFNDLNEFTWFMNLVAFID
jgi:hypothetical protein